MKNLLRVLLVLALVVLPAAAQDAQSGGNATVDAAKEVGSATKKGTLVVTDKVTNKLDINTASKDNLVKLEDVSDATADKIIAGRPYNNKHDLLTRKIVTQPTYDKIKDMIIAHATKK
jgi:DNA uptake protein ComE-like DNA-binding protein